MYKDVIWESSWEYVCPYFAERCTRFHSVPFHPIPSHPIPSHPIPFHSIPFHSIPFHSIPFHSIPFHSTAYSCYRTKAFFCVASIEAPIIALVWVVVLAKWNAHGMLTCLDISQLRKGKASVPPNHQVLTHWELPGSQRAVIFSTS